MHEGPTECEELTCRVFRRTGKKLSIKTAAKTIVLLAVYGTALALALLVYRSYLDGNVNTIAVRTYRILTRRSRWAVPALG